jgi:hypothetical protein
VRASKDILPQAFSAAGRNLEKEDYFLVAEKMLPEFAAMDKGNRARR